MIKLGAYLQIYKSEYKANFVLENFRKFYENSPIYLVSDNGYNFENLSKKYNTYYNHSEINLGIPNFTKEKMFIWLERFKNACEYCNTDYIIYLEDDVLIRNEITIKNHIKCTSGYFNGIPQKLIEYCSKKYKNVNFNTNYYGCCGGAIYHVKTFLSIYDDIIKFINLEYDYIVKELNIHSFGALDMFMPFFYMLYGFEYTKNEEHVDGNRNPNWIGESQPIVHSKNIYNYSIYKEYHDILSQYNNTYEHIIKNYLKNKILLNELNMNFCSNIELIIEKCKEDKVFFDYITSIRNLFVENKCVFRSNIDPIIGKWIVDKKYNFIFLENGTWFSSWDDFGGVWERISEDIVKVKSIKGNNQIFEIESKNGAKWIWQNGSWSGIAVWSNI